MRVTHIFKTYTVICIPASPLNTTFSDTKHRDSFQKTIYWSFHVGFPGENLGSVSSSLTLIWANWPIIPTPECLVAFWGHFPHYGRPPPRSNSSIFLVHDHPSRGITAKSQASMPPKTYIYIIYIYIYTYTHAHMYLKKQQSAFLISPTMRPSLKLSKNAGLSSLRGVVSLRQYITEVFKVRDQTLWPIHQFPNL